MAVLEQAGVLGYGTSCNVSISKSDIFEAFDDLTLARMVVG